jgi:peptidoglycan/xylan/chitin deacetylase (PgdA/CDA1 family)
MIGVAARALAGLLAALVWLPAPPARVGTPVQGQPTRAIALTFDDLPFMTAGGAYFPDARRVTTELLSVLNRHKAPAVGFVNEWQLDVAGDRPARVALLRQWIDAGMTLGNHTYSHPDFNRRTIEQFMNEIAKGDPTVRQLMAPRNPRRLFFRHPMTHTGNTLEKKEAIELFLASRGYLIAPHTIENSDFIFNVVYRRALGTNPARATKVRDAYLEHTAAASRFAESISVQIFGREVAQTLLLHSNTLNADTLDTLLSRYEARGYRFITLEEAMADPAYATQDTVVSDSGPTWLFRWMKSLGMNLSFREDPEVPGWVLEDYHRPR